MASQHQEHQRAEDIHELLDQPGPRGFGRGAENQQRAAEQLIEARARNLGGEKIGEEPDLDAFEFADPDDVFDLLKIGVLGVQNHAVGGMVVEHLDELRDRVGQVELGDDGDGFISPPFEFLAHAGGFGFGADEDEAVFVLALGRTGF